MGTIEEQYAQAVRGLTHRYGQTYAQDALRNNLERLSLSVVRDVVTPTLVWQFYEQGKTDFVKFVSAITPADIKQIHPDGHRTIQEALRETREDILAIQKHFFKEPLKQIGDRHPNHGTKYRGKTHIFYKTATKSELFIKELLQQLGYSPKYYPFEPEIQEGYVKRKFLPISSNGKTSEEIKEFYFNLGYILPLLLAIRAIDLTNENMIINMPYPIFFDLEAICTPTYSKGRYDLYKAAFLLLKDQEWDYSLWSGGTKPSKSLLKGLVRGSNSVPRITWNGISHRKTHNIPTLNGKIINPSHYIKYLLEGYVAGSAYLLNKKEKLLEYVQETSIWTRIILRPTVTYRIAFIEYQFPKVYQMQNYKKFIRHSLELQDIYVGLRGSNRDIIEDEARAVMRGQIPTYYAEIHSPELYTGKGEPVGTLTNSPLEVCLAQAKTLQEMLEANLHILRRLRRLNS